VTIATQQEVTRINREIRAREVRLIAADGKQVGIVSIEDALRRAEEAGLDLVEVAADAKPPVCRIYDYKKALYERKKKIKESRKKGGQTQIKEIKMRVAIDSHDRDTKLNHARDFLEKGDKVKFTIIFRGREITRPELGDKLLQAVTENLKDIAEVEQHPMRAGRQITMIVTRRRDWVPPKTPAGGAPHNSPAAPAAEQ
jgi:translation initiation factor IF-3